MREIIKILIKECDKVEPVTLEQIRRFETEHKLQLPLYYISFLQEVNGLTGFICESYVNLWALQELHSNNVGYEALEYAPNIVLIGSDGGGNAYGIDFDSDYAIVELPFVGMSRENAEIIADSIESLIEFLAAKTYDDG